MKELWMNERMYEMNKCFFKTCACGISDTKSDTKFKYCLLFILRPHSCSSYFNYFTYRFSCHPAHSAWQTGFVKPDKPHLTLLHSRCALASPAQLRDDYLPAPPWKHRQYLLTLQVSRYRLLGFPGSAHTFDSHYAPFPTIGSQLCEINSPRYGWNEHVMVPLSACVQSTYLSCPWIWKGVSATLQSGRYTLSYPRRRCVLPCRGKQTVTFVCL